MGLFFWTTIYQPTVMIKVVTKRRGIPKASQTRRVRAPQTRKPVRELKTNDPQKFWMTIPRLKQLLPQQKRKEVLRGRNLKIMNQTKKKWRKILKFPLKLRYKPRFHDKYYLLPTYST